MTRTQNSFFNMLTNYGAQVLYIVLNFVTRSVFISELGKSYLGIEGFFSNILSVLSLAELGFGAAIVFKLYKAIEVNDRLRMRVLMDFYRKVYIAVGSSIVVLGLCFLPFLPLLKDYDLFAKLGLNGPVVFLIYLLNSAASYWFFAYKTAFVQAQQKNYLLTVVGYAVTVATSLAQILVLVLFHNFLLYLAVQLFFVIVRNFAYAIVCDKKYPYINEKTTERITRAERRGILKDCYALLLYKLNAVVVDTSDTIVLTAFLGFDTEAVYYNYMTIKNSVIYMLDSIIKGLSASLGSINTAGNIEWSRIMFRIVSFLSFWIYGVGAVGVAVLTNDFLHLWFPSENFTVSSFVYNGMTILTPVALLCGIEVYVRGQQTYLNIFRETMGLFQQMRYRPIVSIAVNLILSLATVKYLGIAGCILGTIVSFLFVNMVIDPIAIHRYGLRQSIRPFRFRQLLYMAVTAAAGVICWYLCGLIRIGGWGGFLVHGIVCVLVTCVIFFLSFFRTQEFRYLLRAAKDLIGHGPSLPEG